jgi:uncharacterized membrane protein SpoIIM required for sporulation
MSKLKIGILLLLIISCFATSALADGVYEPDGWAVSEVAIAGAVGILPQTLILFPCIIVFAVRSMNNAEDGIAGKGDNRRRLARHTIFAALLTLIMLLHVLIESFVSPNLVLWALNMAVQ